MTRAFTLVPLLLATALLCAATGAAADRQAGGPEATDTELARHDLVFLGPSRPIILSVHLQIDGRPLRKVQSDSLDEYFTSLDADGDGFLNLEDAESLPRIQRLGAGNGRTTVNWNAADRDPADGMLSRPEFVRRMKSLVGAPLRLREQPRSPTQTVGLFGKLDRDGDGRLSVDEINAASATLAQLDLDHDQAFSIPELQSLQDPNPGGPYSASADNDPPLPVRVIPEDERALDRLIDLLTSRYGDGWPGLEGRESVSRGYTSAAIAGQEDALRSWLRDPPTDLECAVELFQRRRGRPRIRLLTDISSGSASIKEQTSKTLALQLSGIDVELRARNPLTTAYDATQLYKLRFLMADGDKNGYLDSDEFNGLNLPGAGFEEVDRDGDDKLFRNELTAYVKTETAIARTRMTLTVSQESRSLFEILDADIDRRLSPRELRQAAGTLAEFDQDGDGALAETELQGRYRLLFTPGQSPLLDDNPAMAQQAANNVQPRIPESTSGPLWFRRMDRNRDGDVTRQEFLGALDVFDRLDADGDGLLNAQEAETVKESDGPNP